MKMSAKRLLLIPGKRKALGSKFVPLPNSYANSIALYIYIYIYIF